MSAACHGSISYRLPLKAPTAVCLLPVTAASRWSACLLLANSHTPGSAEFNDIYDLAARLFPDCPEANINAAAVALSKRDTRKARRYLSRFSTRQAAFNNMGVLCMLEGNREKAELYLEMAVAAGVERASEVLGELRSKRNLY